MADGPNHFADVSAKAGAFFETKHAARGAAFADFDNDGDWDVLVTSINDAAVLLRNDSVKSDRWTQLTLQGTGCNRDAIGTRVKVKTGVITQMQVVKSAGSYLSDHDRRLLFGLPGFMNPTVEIRWPCGAVQTLEVTPGQAIKIVEDNCRLTQKKPSR